MIFRKRTEASEPESAADWLKAAVKKELPGADEQTILVVCAIAGLLGAAAYADRKIVEEELTALNRELGRVEGLSAAGAGRIVRDLQEHARELTTLETPRYTRALRELQDRELTQSVLNALVDLAASDGEISSDEVQRLRLTTTALGLTQHDYNLAQARHRDKLSALKRQT
jgi:tellurite resistance protein